MSVVKLTQEGISKLRCPEGKRSIQVCDSQHRGLLLEIRRTSANRPTWYVRYKDPSKRTRYVNLGHFPSVSLSQARQLAQITQAEIRLGKDPRAEEDAKKAVPTFSTFFEEEYLPFAKTRKRAWAKDEEYYRLRIKSVLGNVKLDCISRKQIQDLHTSIRTSGLASSTADHYLKLIKRVLGLAHSWGVTTENISKGLPLYMEDNTVENYLNDDELKRLMSVLQTDRNRTICLIVILLLCTGVRKNEALLAEKKYISMDTRVWRIPASSAKAKKMRLLPLSDAAMDVLRQAYADSDSDNDSEYVFINKRTGKPYTTIPKQ